MPPQDLKKLILGAGIS